MLVKYVPIYSFKPDNLSGGASGPAVRRCVVRFLEAVSLRNNPITLNPITGGGPNRPPPPPASFSALYGKRLNPRPVRGVDATPHEFF